MLPPYIEALCVGNPDTCYVAFRRCSLCLTPTKSNMYSGSSVPTFECSGSCRPVISIDRARLSNIYKGTMVVLSRLTLTISCSYRYTPLLKGRTTTIGVSSWLAFGQGWCNESVSVCYRADIGVLLWWWKMYIWGGAQDMHITSFVYVILRVTSISNSTIDLLKMLLVRATYER